jgi:hypothetical protein
MFGMHFSKRLFPPSGTKTTSLYITCIKGQIGVLSKIISVTPKKILEKDSGVD